MKHTLEWFKVGKCIYRDADDCKCASCQQVVKEGLVIRDEQHAEYLNMIQHDMDINYRVTH